MPEKEGIETTWIWLLDKIRTVTAKIPEGMDQEQAQRKLIKIIAGVFMHQVEELKTGISPERANPEVG